MSETRDLGSNPTPKRRKISPNGGSSSWAGSPDEMGGELTQQRSGSTDELALQEASPSAHSLPYRRSISGRGSLESPSKRSEFPLTNTEREDSPDELAPSTYGYSSDREDDRADHETIKIRDQKSWSRSPGHSQTSSGSRRSRVSVRSRRTSASTSPQHSPSPLQSSTASTPRPPSAVPPPLAPTLKEPTFTPYQPALRLTGHTAPISQVKISPSGLLIASSSADSTIRIWSVMSSNDKPLQTLHAHLAGVNCIAWSPNDSTTLASGSDDKYIRLWNTSTGKPYKTPLVGHHNYVSCLAFSPKGNILVSGSYDEALFLWDVRTSRLLRSLPAHQDPVAGVDFVHDGTLIASCGSGDGLIRIWDTHTGQCLKTMIHADNAAVTNVRFSPNGRFVLAWSLDSCVRLWEYFGEGRCVKTYMGHVNGKWGVGGGFGVYGWRDDEEEENEEMVMSPRAFAVSGSEDGAMVFWDVISKEVLQRIEGAHEGCIISVDTMCTGFGPGDHRMSGGGGGNGRSHIVVSGGLDGVVKVWEMVKEVKEIKDRPTAEFNGGGEGEEDNEATMLAREDDTISELKEVKEEEKAEA